MSVTAEFSIPADDFVLGKALHAAPSLTVEIDRLIPVNGGTIPYFWVIDGGQAREEFEASLDREPELSEFTVSDEIDGRTLYRVEWDLKDDAFVQAMVDHDVVLQKASGDADAWRFQLRFPDSDTLSAFRIAYREADADVTVEGVYEPSEPSTPPAELTESQRRLIERAYDDGYFDVPRKVTMADLAEELGVSDQALNERLRRGLQTIIGATLKTDRSTQE